MATVLYFGDTNPATTTAQRAHTLERLGHVVIRHNPTWAVTGVLASSWLAPVHYRTGYRFVQAALQDWLKELVSTTPTPDLIWINSGELLGPACLKILRSLERPIVLYNNDDATGKRDGRRFDLLLQALPLYDLCVVRRAVNVAEYKASGAKEVMLIRMSYDEVAHRPLAWSEHIPTPFRSEVAFIGTWIRHEKRDAFLLELIRRGVPVSIWGDRWHKSPLWLSLRTAHRGASLSGRDYVTAIQGAKLCLGLLSRGNRDLHTRRSVEIPFAGGLLCAERTSEHLEMYQEGVEAAFWSDAAECAAVCKYLLEHPAEREAIRLAGMLKVKSLGVGNEMICSKILSSVFQQTRKTKASTPTMLPL